MAIIRKMRVGDQIQTACGTVLRVVEVRGKVVRVAVEHAGDGKCRLTEPSPECETTADRQSESQ